MSLTNDPPWCSPFSSHPRSYNPFSPERGFKTIWVMLLTCLILFSGSLSLEYNPKPSPGPRPAHLPSSIPQDVPLASVVQPHLVPAPCTCCPFCLGYPAVTSTPGLFLSPFRCQLKHHLLQGALPDLSDTVFHPLPFFRSTFPRHSCTSTIICSLHISLPRGYRLSLFCSTLCLQHVAQQQLPSTCLVNE